MVKILLDKIMITQVVKKNYAHFIEPVNATQE
jgi:hypothetical protein